MKQANIIKKEKYMKQKYPSLLWLLLTCISIKHVSAYLDPGTGSQLIQLLIGAIVMVGFGIKMFWNKIKLFFKDRFAGKNAKK